jgi:hypothetical protein
MISIIEKSLKHEIKFQRITLDMAANMGLIAKMFSNATRVTDRFHVSKLALEALQNQVKYRLDH